MHLDVKDVVLEDDPDGPVEPVFLSGELLLLPLQMSHVRLQQQNLGRQVLDFSFPLGRYCTVWKEERNPSGFFSL